MRAQVAIQTGPFRRIAADVRRPVRIRRLAPKTGCPVVAELNGRPILRAGWRRKLRDGDRLTFHIYLRGNGGNRGGSNPLAFIASIGLMIFAPFAAGALLGGAANTVLFGSFTLGQAASLGILFAGGQLLNALMPMPESGQAQLPSPTYSLQAQGNSARIEQPIPVQYGRLKIYPDFASQPYTEFAGEEQYLYQLLCIGAGQYEIESVLIEDTPISAFSEIAAQVVEPYQPVTLFPAAVSTAVEVSGQELPGHKAMTWSRSGTTFTITETAHGRVIGDVVQLNFTTGGGPFGVYTITSIATNSFTVEGPAVGTSGSGFVYTNVGGVDGFAVAAAGTVTERIGVDFVLPEGLNEIAGSDLNARDVYVSIYARPVDDSGAPTGSWFALGNERIVDRTRDMRRRTFSYNVTPGRYHVRAFRTDLQGASSTGGHRIAWTAARAYLRSPQTFGNVTMLAIRMRATNNLSQQASRRVAVICTRKLPVWNGSTWSAPVATRSIAWALADMARNVEYGAGQADDRIDLDGLLQLDGVWAARGDFFDGRFDQASTWWEDASKVARAGRARIFRQGGVIRCVRDSAPDTPVALFSQRNIKRGSFSLDVVLPETASPDCIEVAYFDRTQWREQRVTAALPGSARARPVKMQLFGVTSREHALREGLYEAAVARYRRVFCSFDTEMDGFIPVVGDAIRVQHDSVGWGQHGEVRDWDAASGLLRLSEVMDFSAGGNHYIAFRADDAGQSGPWLCVETSDPFVVRLLETPDFTPTFSGDREPTQIMFGPGTLWSALCKVVDVRPNGLYDVTIQAVVDDPSVHTADFGAVAPPIVISSLPGRIVQPVVGPLLARLMPDDSTRFLLAWQPAVGADVYHVEVAEGDDVDEEGISWTRVIETTATQAILQLLSPNLMMVRVRGVGLAAGPYRAGVMGRLIDLMWIGPDSDPMWTGSDSDPMWS